MYRLSCVGACALSLGASAVVAEDAPETFDNFIVTATRTSIAVEDALVPVIVIDRETIDRSLATDVAELLRFHAGLDIARNGSPGQTTSLFLRGTESNHTLVMIDGVKINPGTIGGAALQNISPDVVERVEVVKGPRSSLYGSEAIGGVINVITRRADSGPYLDGRVGAGRYDTRDLNLSAGLDSERGSVSLNASWFDTDGFPTLVTDDTDRGYDNVSLSFAGTMGAGPVDIGLEHWQAEGTTEYSDFFANPVDQDYENRATTLELSGRPSGQWQTRLRLSRIVDDIDQNQSDDFVETRRNTLDWQNDLSLGTNQVLTAGLYVSREDTESLSFGLGFDEDTDVEAVYVQDDITLAAHRLLLAARYTDHETFGTELTWNVEYGFDVSPATTLTAGVGTAFRAPDSTDRFGFGGNPDLDPESSTNIELGVRHRFNQRQSLRVSAFQNDIDDLIQFVITDPMTFAGENRNVEEARIQGIEAEYRYDGSDWSLRTEAIWQDPENRTDDMRLLRRAEQSLTLGVVKRLGTYEIGLDVLASGDREDFAAELGSYMVANLTARVSLGEHWSVQGKVENLLDKEYQTAAGFNMAERALFVAVRYTAR